MPWIVRGASSGMVASSSKDDFFSDCIVSVQFAIVARPTCGEVDMREGKVGIH